MSSLLDFDPASAVEKKITGPILDAVGKSLLLAAMDGMDEDDALKDVAGAVLYSHCVLLVSLSNGSQDRLDRLTESTDAARREALELLFAQFQTDMASASMGEPKGSA